MAGPKQVSNQKVSAHTVNSSIVALHVVQLDSTGGIVSGGAGGGSTQVSVRDILTSSGVSVMDSTNNAIGVTIRGGAASGTEYTDGDVDATVSGQAILFDNSSNTLRPVTLTRGLPVNIVAGAAGGSTTVQVSSVGGVVVNRIIDRDSSSQVAAVLNTDPPSTTYGLAVRQVGAVAASTTVQVSSVGGAVIIRSSAASALVTAYQSSAADLNVTVAGYSTTANVSSVGGVVSVAPASSGATGFFAVRLSDGSTFVTDSTERAIRVNVVAGSAGGSTIVTVSTGSIRVHQSTAADLLVEPRLSTANKNSSAYLPVRITDGTEFQSLLAGYTDGSTTSTLAAPGLAFQNGSNATMRLAGSSTPFPVHIRTDSGASVMDSTESAIKVNVVAGAAGGSTLVTVRQSTYTDFNGLFRLADRDASTQIAVVTNTDPASTAYALAVRQVGGTPGSTTVNVSSLAGAVIVRSSAANLLASVYQSTAADLNVTVAGYSTTANVSSLAGRVAIAGFHATDGITNVTDSTNTAIRVNVVAGAAGGSTEVTVRQSTYTDFNTLSRIADRDASTQVAAVLNDAPASTVWALAVRQVGATPGSTTVNVSSLAGRVAIALQHDSAGIINAADSTNNALRVNVVAGAAGGSTEVTVRQSTYTDFNTLSRIADRDQSTQVAAVLNDSPASTVWALAVRQVGGTPGSTTVNVSSLAGNVTVSPLSSGATGFFAVRVSDGSTFLQPSIEYTNGSTVSTLVGGGIAYNNSSNDTMRLVGVTQPLPVQMRSGTLGQQSTTALITSTHSTAVYSLISSVAGLRHKVTAIYVGSTHTNPSTILFMSSLAQTLWAVNFGSGSSGITGAISAKNAPDFFFATEASAALNVIIEGGNSTAASTTIARVSVSYFSEA
jgi:hypothetical protein